MVRLAQAAALVVLSVPAYAGLIARQVPVDTSSIPASCSSTCQSLVTSVQNGCLNDISCTCSSAFATSLRPCVQCAYDAAPTQFNGTPDQLFQQYSEGCTAAGLPVDGSGSSASITGSATGTAIGSVSGSSTLGSVTVSVTGTSTLTTVKTTGTGTTNKPTSTGTNTDTTSQSSATTSAGGGSGSSGSSAISIGRNVVGIAATVGVIVAWFL